VLVIAPANIPQRVNCESQDELQAVRRTACPQVAQTIDDSPPTPWESL